MYGLSAGTKTSGGCKEVALSGGLTVFWRLTLAWAYIFSHGFFWGGGGGGGAYKQKGMVY